MFGILYWYIDEYSKSFDEDYKPAFCHKETPTFEKFQSLSKQFQWLGRSDFVINSGGVKLNPEIIEQKLSEYIPVSFFITGLSDTKLGQKLALVIENPLDYFPNKSPLFKILEKYEIPKVFAVVHMLDRTKSGKINRYKTLKKININDWKELV